MFDFDRVIDRRGTHASKWDMMAKLSGIAAADGIPMWVADMDFAAPPGVTEALTEIVTRAVHGYYADTGSWASARISSTDQTVPPGLCGLQKNTIFVRGVSFAASASRSIV